MLYLHPPDLIATANKILQHYSAVHHLLFQKNKAMELWFFFSFEPRGTFAGETIKEEMGTSPSFHESTVPLTLQLPLFQPRHTGPSPAGVFWLHLPFNVLSTCPPSRWCGVGATQHYLLFDNSSQEKWNLMEAAARLQRHPQSTGASRHHSSDGSNNASSKEMHLCWRVSLVPSVQPWSWLHPRCLQDGTLIIYLTTAPSSGKDSPFPQAPARSKIHRELRVSAPLPGYTHQPWSLWQSWKGRKTFSILSLKKNSLLSRVF